MVNQTLLNRQKSRQVYQTQHFAELYDAWWGLSKVRKHDHTWNNNRNNVEQKLLFIKASFTRKLRIFIIELNKKFQMWFCLTTLWLTFFPWSVRLLIAVLSVLIMSPWCAATIFLDFNFVGIECEGYQAIVVEIRCQQLNDNSEKINSIPDWIQDQVKKPTYFQFETKLICCQRRL